MSLGGWSLRQEIYIWQVVFQAFFELDEKAWRGYWVCFVWEGVVLAYLVASNITAVPGMREKLH